MSPISVSMQLPFQVAKKPKKSDKLPKKGKIVEGKTVTLRSSSLDGWWYLNWIGFCLKYHDEAFHAFIDVRSKKSKRKSKSWRCLACEDAEESVINWIAIRSIRCSKAICDIPNPCSDIRKSYDTCNAWTFVKSVAPFFQHAWRDGQSTRRCWPVSTRSGRPFEGPWVPGHRLSHGTCAQANKANWKLGSSLGGKKRCERPNTALQDRDLFRFSDQGFF